MTPLSGSPLIAQGVAATREEAVPGMSRVLAAADRNPGSGADILRRLSQSLGPRLTGSPALGRSVRWAEQEMRVAGLRDVHREAWQLPEGWRRGSATVRVRGAGGRKLSVAAFGWTGSTEGTVHGELLAVHSADRPPPGQWKGRVLIELPGSDGFKDLFELPSLARAALSAGAVALLVPDSRAGPVHTGPMGLPGESSRLPVLSLRGKDASWLRSAMASGPLHLELSVTNRFIPGPVDAWNVSGQIPGRDSAAGTILLGAHLDSWDLSPGIADDGYGVAVVLAAARALHSAGVVPRRTIRFVLFSGEEQGLAGSRAYVQQHAAELDSLLAAVVVDWGDGPITKLPFAGHAEAAQSLQAVLGAGGYETIPTVPGYLTFTDAFSFSAAGIAGLSPLQDSPMYTRRGHSAEDTLANTSTRTLPGNVRLVAALVFGLAQLPNSPILRLSSSATAAQLDRLHLPASFAYPIRGCAREAPCPSPRPHR